MKTVWYWHKGRHEDQWNRIKNPDIDLHIYGQLIFDECVKTIQEKGKPFQQNKMPLCI